MELRVIKSQSDYEAALGELRALLRADVEPGSPDGDRLELLALLVQDFESKEFPIDLPTPIDAIRFRMEQKGLMQRDLIPYFGSASRVSEVLTGKRQLTVQMIRSLNKGLGIPIEVLAQESQPTKAPISEDVDWSRFPLKELAAKGWLNLGKGAAVNLLESAVRDLVLASAQLSAIPIYHRKSQHIRSKNQINDFALVAWAARVIQVAHEQDKSATFRRGTLTSDFMKEVVRFSYLDEGPRIAIDFLRKSGIIVVVVPHLSHTYLDGAATLLKTGQPVIGLTIRQDRLDNFWFTLLHEMAHVMLHLSNDDSTSYFDELNYDDSADARERDADDLARESMIPSAIWNECDPRILHTPDVIIEFADKMRISPSIVAGRIRYEFKKYQALNQLIGNHQVRKLFTEIDWRVTK